jgi:hypothetical protein
VQVDADGQRRLVSSATARSDRPMRVLLNSKASTATSTPAGGREQVELAEQHAAQFQRHVLDAQVQRPHLRRPSALGQALDDEAQAQRGHEQGDLRAVDQGPQHQRSISSAPSPSPQR